jgi:Ca2+-binding RTX toxin-like protein
MHRPRLRRQALRLGLLVTLVVLALSACGGGQAKSEVENPSVGTDGPETLRGTNRDDNLYGAGGNDILFALGGEDNLRGGEDKDWVLGGDERRAFGGDKKLEGGPGNDGHWGGLGSDTVLGGSGNDFVAGDDGSDSAVMGEEGKDLVLGGAGGDRIVGGEGTDILTSGPIEERATNTLSGGAGDDIFVVDNVPASKDRVSCGRGFDRVIADRKDMVAADCEKVRVVHGTEEEVIQQEAAFFETVPPAVTEFFGPWDPFFPTFFEEQLAPDPTVGG